jgi:hypothetical protein
VKTCYGIWTGNKCGDLLGLFHRDSDRDLLGDFDGLLDWLLEGDLDEDLLGEKEGGDGMEFFDEDWDGL